MHRARKSSKAVLLLSAAGDYDSLKDPLGKECFPSHICLSERPNIGSYLISPMLGTVPWVIKRLRYHYSYKPQTITSSPPGRWSGPALNGPALNGPALNGPALNGPATTS